MAKLVLLRHGESAWNAENRFTGWVDIDLTKKGEEEARLAGAAIGAEPGLDIDLVFTSVLTRAVRTANIALAAANRSYLPVTRHWRLNERHYGALQTLNKDETAARHGAEQVLLWRRSYATPPPPVERSDPNHPSHDPRYALVPPASLPATECLADVVARLVPYYEDAIAPELIQGRNVLVVAHGNSLRALAKYLEQISDDDVIDFEIPTGVPRLYELGADLSLQGVRYLDVASVGG